MRGTSWPTPPYRPAAAVSHARARCLTDAVSLRMPNNPWTTVLLLFFLPIHLKGKWSFSSTFLPPSLKDIERQAKNSKKQGWRNTERGNKNIHKLILKIWHPVSPPELPYVSGGYKVKNPLQASQLWGLQHSRVIWQPRWEWVLPQYSQSPFLAFHYKTPRLKNTIMGKEMVSASYWKPRTKNPLSPTQNKCITQFRKNERKIITMQNNEKNKIK